MLALRLGACASWRNVTAMNDKFNTIAGWILGGGIVLLGGTLVAGEMFSGEAPHTKGYPIEGVVEEGKSGSEAPEVPIATLLASADAARGEASFRKCAACHTINQGGANGVGPNLWGVMGAPLGHNGAFAYSDALKGLGGNWDFERMAQWLHRPGRFAPGTKMTFAGLSDAQERADLILYLNSQGSNLPLPAAPAPGAAPAEGNAAAGNAAAPAAASNTAAPATGNAAAPATGSTAPTKGGGEAHPASTNPGGH